MTIGEIAQILDALVLSAPDLALPIEEAFGADMMSDVLAFVNEKTVLITGLTNPHVIRTAEIADIACIVFARGKIPDQESAGISLCFRRRKRSIPRADCCMRTGCADARSEGE